MSVSNLIAAVPLAVIANIWPPPPIDETQLQLKKPLSAVRAAECQRVGMEGNIFGETAHVRGETGLPQMSPELARAIAASKIAQNRTHAIRFLTPFLEANATNNLGGEARLARVNLAYILLRLAQYDIAEERGVIRGLLPAEEFEGWSDAYYINALVYEAEGNRAAALEALEKAVTVNPKFYNAVVLKAILRMRNADVGFREKGDCNELYTEVSRAIVPVARLGACPLQLAHFRLALDRRMPRSKSERRVEMAAAVDLALAFAARKDKLHKEMLEKYQGQKDHPGICKTVLHSYDFGRVLD